MGGIRVGPNPTLDGFVTITGSDVQEVIVYDAAGKRVGATLERKDHAVRLRLPDVPGTYCIVVRDEDADHLFRLVRTSGP